MEKEELRALVEVLYCVGRVLENNSSEVYEVLSDELGSNSPSLDFSYDLSVLKGWLENNK